MIEPKILIADDDEALLALIARRMDRLGYKYDQAGNGHAALALIEHERYDLIVTDIYMPGATGLEILRAARDHDRHIQVVVMTAAATLENAIEALNSGAFSYLTKPFDHLSVLDNAVNRALEFRRLLLDNERMAKVQRRRGDMLEEEVTHRIQTFGQKRKQLLDLLSSISDGILLLDKDGRILISNHPAQTWLNKDLEDPDQHIHRFLEDIWKEPQISRAYIQLDDVELEVEATEYLGEGGQHKVILIHEMSTQDDGRDAVLVRVIETLRGLIIWLRSEPDLMTQDEAADLLSIQISDLEQLISSLSPTEMKTADLRPEGATNNAWSEVELGEQGSWPPSLPEENPAEQESA
jgi:CheY-like chemotaxis protein